MRKYKDNIKKVIFLILFNFFLVNSSLSSELKKIEIEGNKRLADETIILFSTLKLGDKINSKVVNNAFKSLFETNYFKDLKINFTSDTIKITVEENPIIQEIKIYGIKNKSILKELTKITRKAEKYPFIEQTIIDQKNQLNNIIRMNGFYFSEIGTKIIDNKKVCIIL